VRVTAVDGGGDRRVLVVEGDVIDPPHAAELYDALCAHVRAGASAVDVDLSAVELFGAAGVTGLMRARVEATRVGCAVSVVAASNLARRVLEVADVAEALRLPER
jgi:hypothetical protein